MYNKGNENIAFRYRYIILCIAGIVGPVIGNVLSIVGIDWMIRIIGIGCILSCLALIKMNKEEDDSQEVKEKIKNCNINFSIVLFVVWSILVFTVFSVFEKVSPLAIQPYSLHAEKLFSIMIILNSILAIIFQPVIIILNNKLRLIHQIIIGSMAFFFSYILFGYSNGKFIPLMLATGIFTVGEAVLIPMLDVMISKISDYEQLTGIYAISEVKQIGFFIGPVLSTYFIQVYSVTTMYWMVALTCICSMIIALILLRLISRH